LNPGFLESDLWVLGNRGSMIVTRVFAIFIAAFAVQFIINGVSELFV
jgi:multiple antibiotic resistance protein